MVSTESTYMKLNYTHVFCLSLIYLMLPVILFFIFFLKAVWAVLFTAASVGACYLAIRDQKRNTSDIKGESCLTIRPSLLFGGMIFALVWAYISGIGEFAWASADHTVRAAVLNDLVNYSWPVKYDMATQTNPAVISALPEGKAMFAYYFTFWLVPALSGKLLGITAARVILVIWSALGLYLLTLGLCFYMHRTTWLAPLFFVIFGGIDIIPYLVRTFFLDGGATWEGWNIEMWIHGNFYQTMNTFHQCIPGWLVTIMILNCRNNRHIGTIGALMFCYSPWATIGLLPIAVCELISSRWKEAESRRLSLKNIFSYGNLVMPVIIFCVFALFYTSNSNATAIKGFIWEFFSNYKLMLICYAGYVIFEFGIWYLIIYRLHRKEPLYWVSLITLLVFPVYKMSEANDLLMRGTLAPMFVLAVMALSDFSAVVDRFRQRGQNNDFRALGFFAVIFATAIVPFLFLTTEIGATREIYMGLDQSVQPQDKIVSFGNIVDEEYTEVTKRQFYVFEYEDQLFYRVFGKS